MDVRNDRLARAGAARARRSPRRGLVLIVGGIALFAVPFTVLTVLWLHGADVTNWQAGPMWLAATTALVLARQGGRIRARDAARVLAEDTRPPVVYLRPFDTDGRLTVHRWSERTRISPRERFEPTHEQRLARTLRRVGPVVAVGDPTESLPQLGAARLFAADDEWRARVDEFLAAASVVLVQAGASRGIEWEVGRVIGRDEPQRLILALPLQAPRGIASRQERYTAFRLHFAALFPRPLPEAIGHCHFLYFDRDWTPHLLGGRPPGADERARALRALSREFKAAWGPRWLRVTAYSLPVAVAALLVAALNR